MISQIPNGKSKNYISNGKSTNVKTRAYQFSLEVIKTVNNLPEKRAFWVIGDQLLRAATSIGANLFEAQSSSSKREFCRFYEIALKSANETKYWLSLLKDSYPDHDYEAQIEEATEIANMIGASLLTIRRKRDV